MQDARCLKVKPRERAFKQFKSPVLIVLILLRYFTTIFSVLNLDRPLLSRLFSLIKLSCDALVKNKQLTVYTTFASFTSSIFSLSHVKVKYLKHHKCFFLICCKDVNGVTYSFISIYILFIFLTAVYQDFYGAIFHDG